MEVVQVFENNMDRLAEFLNNPAEIAKSALNLPYNLRFNGLVYRARLIVLEEGARMLAALRSISDDSQHTALLLNGLQDITISESRHHVAKMHSVIAWCETKGLKRLEAELRILQICFHLILKEVGVISDLKAELSLRKVFRLCQTYPDTAGLLVRTHNLVKKALNGGQTSTTSLYAKDMRTTLWTWPRHRLGDLKQCTNGHPYSGTTWVNCPECGKEVPQPDPADHKNHLKEDEFVVAMRTQRFKEKSWRV